MNELYRRGLVMIHPRYRPYIAHLILEVLRDSYYRYGATYGWNTAAITANVRGMLTSDAATDAGLDHLGLNADLIQVLLNELVADRLVTYHKAERRLWHLFRVGDDYWYRLTPEGLADVKARSAPPRLQVSVNGDMHVLSADSVSVAGDAFITKVEKLVQADEDLRRFVEETRRLNFHSVQLLEKHVYGVLAENARLRAKVESRGWSLLEFAMIIAKLVLV